MRTLVYNNDNNYILHLGLSLWFCFNLGLELLWFGFCCIYISFRMPSTKAVTASTSGLSGQVSSVRQSRATQRSTQLRKRDRLRRSRLRSISRQRNPMQLDHNHRLLDNRSVTRQLAVSRNMVKKLKKKKLKGFHQGQSK